MSEGQSASGDKLVISRASAALRKFLSPKENALRGNALMCVALIMYLTDLHSPSFVAAMGLIHWFAVGAGAVLEDGAGKASE